VSIAAMIEGFSGQEFPAARNEVSQNAAGERRRLRAHGAGRARHLLLRRVIPRSRLRRRSERPPRNRRVPHS
jgi:hypothetical protein